MDNGMFNMIRFGDEANIRSHLIKAAEYHQLRVCTDEPISRAYLEGRAASYIDAALSDSRIFRFINKHTDYLDDQEFHPTRADFGEKITLRTVFNQKHHRLVLQAFDNFSNNLRELLSRKKYDKQKLDSFLNTIAPVSSEARLEAVA